ncbi:MAG TPA: LysR family transcriptional regulator [Paracoccaceae bacterium]|nr:LysR family transcriptional regulator [Paracoccaceae bacterium]
MPAEFTLRGLRVFVALAEAGSLGVAAARLGISLSGLSQHVTALEQAVGARLFDRRARPVTLTPAGQALRGHARRILSVVSEAQADLAEFHLSSLPRLNLAIIDDLDASVTPVIVAALQGRYPRCFVHAVSGRSDQVIDRLVAREADIGVTAMDPPGDGFRSLPLLRESFVLVAARGVLDGVADVRGGLEALPFVPYSPDIPIGRKVARHLSRVRLAVESRLAFEATRSVLAMVVQARGWTITTPLNLLDAQQFLDQVDVRALPFAGETRTVALVARAGELGHLPDDLARDCRALVRDVLVPRFDALAPALAGAIVVQDED